MNKAFQKPWHSFRVLPNVSLKCCSMSILKTLLMYRIYITKRPREILQRLADFWVKKKWHSQVIWMFRTFGEYSLLPEKQMRLHCSIMHTFEKTFQPMQMQRHGPIIWVKPNWTSFHICTRFSLSTSPSQARVMGFIFCTTAISTEIWRCSSWQRRTFIELFWLCSWNNCSHLQTKGWYMAATLGQWCKISGCGFARWLDYQPWRVKGSRRYDCVLCFMNWVY